MLLATGFVNRRGQFLPPTQNPRIHTLDRSQKYLLLVITSLTPTAAPNLVQIRPRGDSGQMGKIKRFFVYLYLFRELTYRSDSSTDFHVWWLKRRGLAQGCAFRGFRWYRSPFWGRNPPKTALSKLFHWFPPNFAQQQRLTSGHRGWSQLCSRNPRWRTAAVLKTNR